MPSTDKLKTRDQDAHPAHHYPFWFGGSASCFAASVTHPLDLSTQNWRSNGQIPWPNEKPMLMRCSSQGRLIHCTMALISQLPPHILAEKLHSPPRAGPAANTSCWWTKGDVRHIYIYSAQGWLSRSLQWRTFHYWFCPTKLSAIFTDLFRSSQLPSFANSPIPQLGLASMKNSKP